MSAPQFNIEQQEDDLYTVYPAYDFANSSMLTNGVAFVCANEVKLREKYNLFKEFVKIDKAANNDRTTFSINILRNVQFVKSKIEVSKNLPQASVWPFWQSF